MCTWHWASNGKFTVGGAYDLLSIDPMASKDHKWAAVWSFRGPQRVRLFLWLVMYGRLLTNAERCRRHMADDPSCISCGACEENIEHIFRSCSNAAAVCNSLVPNNKRNMFFHLPFEPWLMENLKDNTKIDDIDWSCLFGLTVWKVWSARNDIVFQEASFNSSRIIAQCQAWGRAVNSNEIEKMTTKNRVTKLIQWSAPAPGCWKLNTDGAVKNSAKEAAAGGVFRNSSGDWFLGYARRLGECSVLSAELWAIYDGLKLAYEYNLQNVVVECDNSTAVLMVNSRGNEGCNYGIVRHIWSLIDKQWQVEIKHVYREANRTADFIANWGMKMNERFRLLNDPPRGVGHLFQLDKIGNPVSRSVVA